MHKALKPGPLVLIVEDTPDILTLMVYSMAGLWKGMRIRCARDGASGMNKLLALRPDLLITDLHLPHLGGIELCRRIREERDLSHVKIVATTAFHNSRTNRLVLESGADEYLAKPFSPEELRRSAIRLVGLDLLESHG